MYGAIPPGTTLPLPYLGKQSEIQHLHRLTLISVIGVPVPKHHNMTK
jgi:hypothetical protein